MVDIDDDALARARERLGTATIKDTVNESLRLAGADRERDIAQALEVLAAAPLHDRQDAWR